MKSSRLILSFLVLTAILLCTTSGKAQLQPQNNKWCLPPNLIDFSTGSPIVSSLPTNASIPWGYLGQSAAFCSNAIHDNTGELVFFIVDEHVYDKDGEVIEYFNTGGSGIPTGYSEISIIPDVVNCDKYHIFYYIDKVPYYALLDMNEPSIHANGKMGKFIFSNGESTPFSLVYGINSLIPDYRDWIVPPKINGGYIAVSTIQNNDFRFVFLCNTNSIFRLRINSSGLIYDNYKIPLPTNRSEWQTVRAEMEIIQLSSGGFRIACSYQGGGNLLPNIGQGIHVYVSDLDVQGNLVVTSERVFNYPIMGDGIPWVHGLEFSPSGDILYVSHEVTTNAPNPIEYINLQAPLPFSVPLQVTNANDFQLSQIELGADEKIYLASSDRLASLTNPDNPSISNWNDNAVPLNYQASLGYGSIGYVTYILPDQIDGKNYFNCKDEYTDLCPSNYCCLGENLVENGDFESGNIGFTSEYIYETTVASGAIQQGEYSIINGSQAPLIDPSWNDVQYPTCCSDSNGSFLIANGENIGTASAQKVIWEQTITVEDWKSYKFCMKAKNLDDCSSNTPATLDVVFSMTNIGDITETVNITGDACEWQEIEKGFGLYGYGTSLTIQIILDQSQSGECNDIAIDGIALIILDSCPSESAEFDIRTVTPNPANSSYYSIIGNAHIEGLCESIWWGVCEYDFFTDDCVPNTQLNGVWWSQTTDFPSYDGTDIQNENHRPGLFEFGKFYRITRGTWGRCNSWAQKSKYIGALAYGMNIGIYEEEEFKANEQQLIQKLSSLESAIGMDSRSTNTIKTDKIMVSPNPFLERTTINWQLSKPQEISILLFDTYGRQVQEIQALKQYQSGEHQFVFQDGGLASGVYLIVLKTAEQIFTKSVVVTE